MSDIVFSTVAVGSAISIRIMRHLGCTSIVNDAGDCYPKSKAEVKTFKQTNVLYITTTAPDSEDVENLRRVIQYEDVMAQIQR